MAADYQLTYRRYGRFYKNVRTQMQRKEVLVSTNIILTLLTISFFAVFAIRPTALTISKLWREIKDKKTVETQLEMKISDLAETQSALALLKEDLVLLDNAIPPNMDFSRFARTIEYLASTHGLLITSNSYSNIELWLSAERASASATEIKTHSFLLKLRGSFSDIRSFIAELEQLNRLISITSVSIQPAKNQERRGLFDLNIGIDSNIYSFPEGVNLEK